MISAKNIGYVGIQPFLSPGLALTLTFLYLKVLSILVTVALSDPSPFVAVFFALEGDTAASDVLYKCNSIAQHVLK